MGGRGHGTRGRISTSVAPQIEGVGQGRPIMVGLSTTVSTKPNRVRNCSQRGKVPIVHKAPLKSEFAVSEVAATTAYKHRVVVHGPPVEAEA